MTRDSAGRVIGLIPARGGSRSVPGKNILPIAGKPLIGWTIDAARDASSVGRTLVSTESEEIAAVARECGAEVPFLRPEELARDDTPGMEVVLHALRWLRDEDGGLPDWIILLQPTSPLRRAMDIDAALRLALEEDADAVVSVVATKQHPYWTRTLDADGRLVDFLEAGRGVARRQDLPPAYSLNGALYLGKPDVLLEAGTFYTDRTFPYIMPPERSLDVDTAWDHKLTELVLADRKPHA